jgi:YegS/Rv2252/BmrU family lipid kinase
MNTARGPVVIVNPRSGGGMDARRWAKLVGPLTEGLGPFDTRFTERPGHGREMARDEAAGGRSLVIACGGDGTISEVAGGLIDAGTAAALGIIPRGTGGDFCRALELSADPAKAARRIGAGTVRAIDAGRVTFVSDEGTEEQRSFVNVASFGFSSLVAARANRSAKRLGAKVAFLGAIVNTVVSYDHAEVSLSIDGGPRKRMTVLLAAVGNGRFFGGGMKVCPEALLDDGALDLVVLGDFGLPGFFFKIMPRAYQGTHLSLAGVQSARVRTVEVWPADPEAVIPVEIDGETPGRLPAKFEIVPGALRLRL